MPTRPLPATPTPRDHDEDDRRPIAPPMPGLRGGGTRSQRLPLRVALAGLVCLCAAFGGCTVMRTQADAFDYRRVVLEPVETDANTATLPLAAATRSRASGSDATD
jgi:hypothetical protein